jgi:hypothetical protein
VARAKFRYVGDHAQDLPGGGLVAPGDFVHLNDEEQQHPLIQDLLASDRLLPTGSASERAADKADRDTAKREKEATT